MGEPEITPTKILEEEGVPGRIRTGQGGQKAKHRNKQNQSYLSFHEHIIRPNTLPPILLTAARTEDTNSERLSDVPKAAQQQATELGSDQVPGELRSPLPPRTSPGLPREVGSF